MSTEPYDWMASIPRTGDLREVHACEGALAELADMRDHECDTDAERAACAGWIEQIHARYLQLIHDGQ